ncbi:cupin domain-containing protein [Paenibacillus radicis (ex Xue et al. 2023)]|uniref:Cupin domain-containing protein n=1 Tax=Paenibacillus radicis (ex Xue et al. 2023) TaxID=2972489 RepID=A0ABT1YM26_9BACL|nr:cupin domain-containing protein [Paenibacillus radicis (ex Xue et al. 2023)]MCR8633785.1 cupin domain-containing protein [Paenibacillus radicis (ex Xue et al. 2023)]
MISKHNAEHYTWGDNCDGWRLVNNEEKSIIHEKMPPATSEVRHYHNKASQFFFILSGVMHIEINGTEFTIGQHEGIEVLPLQAHQVFNKTEQDIEFLVISQPNTKNDRVPL